MYVIENGPIQKSILYRSVFRLCLRSKNRPRKHSLAKSRHLNATYRRMTKNLRSGERNASTGVMDGHTAAFRESSAAIFPEMKPDALEKDKKCSGNSIFRDTIETFPQVFPGKPCWANGNPTGNLPKGVSFLGQNIEGHPAD